MKKPTKKAKVAAVNTAEVAQLGLVGARVKALRDTRGWNQTALAHYIGASQGDISQIETGQQDAFSHRVAALALVLGCSADYLLGLTDDPTPYRRIP